MGHVARTWPCAENLVVHGASRCISQHLGHQAVRQLLAAVVACHPELWRAHGWMFGLFEVTRHRPDRVDWDWRQDESPGWVDVGSPRYASGCAPHLTSAGAAKPADDHARRNAWVPRRGWWARSPAGHRCSSERRRCWWSVKAAAARTRLLQAWSSSTPPSTHARWRRPASVTTQPSWRRGQRLGMPVSRAWCRL
jgi:hypothetical protein